MIDPRIGGEMAVPNSISPSTSVVPSPAIATRKRTRPQRHDCRIEQGVSEAACDGREYKLPFA